MTRTLGKSDVSVTALGFGAASIGNLYRAVDDDQAARTIAAAWDAGIRYFDTAPHYGLGLSEQRLGHGLSAYPRNEFVISTKVGRILADQPEATWSDLDDGSESGAGTPAISPCRTPALIADASVFQRRSRRKFS